jgi:hypothetical protein
MRRSSGGKKSDHLQKLESLFGGAGSASTDTGRRPDTGLQQKRRGSPEQEHKFRGPSQHKIRLERIKAATTSDELSQAIDVFVAHHELPGDLDVLLKVLHHPKEEVVRKGLAELVGMVQRGELSGTSVIGEALDELRGRVSQPETISYIDGLQQMIGS